MPTECELCHEDYEKADDEPQDICPSCWAEQQYYADLASEYAGPAVVVVEDGDDDDHGECGPTCGKYGNW